MHSRHLRVRFSETRSLTDHRGLVTALEDDLERVECVGVVLDEFDVLEECRSCRQAVVLRLHLHQHRAVLRRAQLLHVLKTCQKTQS